MPKRKAGQNVRNLAAKRKFKAIQSFVAAGVVIISPIAIIKAFENFYQTLTRNLSASNPGLNPATNPGMAIKIPPMFYVLLVVAGLGLVINGIYWWKLAERADQGARGEEATAETMEQLAQEGWQIEYGLMLEGRMGDVDIFCISPKGQAYAIDVKSHRGEIQVEDGQLVRRMGSEAYPFEKDFLVQVMNQAKRVKEQQNQRFVTPIIAFSDARVNIPFLEKQRGVHVVEKARLVHLLRKLG